MAARLYKDRSAHQLTFLEVASLFLYVFAEFVDRNSDFICSLSSTATEAGLLIGKSVNTAALIRKPLGVRKL